MKKYYAKSSPEYDGEFDLDAEKILAALKRVKGAKKKPTSIALDEKTISELKREASKKEIPYQTLMRVLILDGLARMRKAA